MPRRLALRFAVAALALAAASAPAQVAPTTAVPFLQIEPDSRSVGRGLTGVAAADDAGALFWNPAGLAGQTGTSVAFTHAPWLPDLDAGLSFEHLAATRHVAGVGTVAAHVTYLNMGEQERADDEGTALGSFRSYDLAAGVSFGRTVTPGLDAGGGVRLVRSNLAGGSASAGTRAGVSVAADLGARLRLPALAGGRVQPRLGLALTNAGPGLRYSDAGEADPLPTTLRAGAVADVELDASNRLAWSLDAARVLPRRDVGTTATSAGGLETVTVGTGLEYRYDDLLALRTGYFYEAPANGNRQMLTFGAGVRYSLVGVDLSYLYALTEDSPLAGQLYVSLSLRVP